MDRVTLGEETSISLRPAEESDLQYVVKSWLRSYWHDSDYARAQGRVYHVEHRRLVLRLIQQGAVTVAAWSGDPDTIIGFACTRAGVVHYVYVREEFRRMGIAHLLVGPMASHPVEYTHRTSILRKLPLPAAWSFNMYRWFQ